MNKEIVTINKSAFSRNNLCAYLSICHNSLLVFIAWNKFRFTNYGLKCIPEDRHIYLKLLLYELN